MLVEEIGMNELQADRIMQLFVDHISVKLSVYRCFISCDCNFKKKKTKTKKMFT